MMPTLQLPWMLPASSYQDLSPYKWPILLSSITIAYLTLVRLLRFRNVQKLQATYASYLQNPYTMSYQIAHKIMKTSMLEEYPWMFVFGTSWALVKTYSIASGTSLLVQTGQLASPSTVGKRAEDTGVFIGEFVIGSADSERGMRALAKVNWLHGRYGSKIGNDEMIHTLAMFILEPQRWIEKYEWRAMIELERVAAFVYWKEIGNRMGIKNIPATLEEMQAWVDEFEKTHMVYAETNRICAESTTNLFLRNVPSFMGGFVRKVAASFLEKRVRVATGTSEPPVWGPPLADSILHFRGWLIRHFFLPRFYAKDPLSIPDADGRLQRKEWLFEPWYIKSTRRNKVAAWFKTLGSLQPGHHFKEAGYLPEELGPVQYENISKESVLKQVEAMKLYVAEGGSVGVGCPFAFVSR